MKIFSINSNILFYPQYKRFGKAGTIFGRLNLFQKILRKLCVKKIPKILPLFYTKEFKESGRTEDSIIIFDSSLTPSAANYIKRKYPDLRVIYWFWNHIYNPNLLYQLDESIEKWTYDPEDAKKYNLNLNSQFYFPNLAEENTEDLCLPKFDCLFVGSDKNRKEMLLGLKTSLEAENLKPNFIIAEDGKLKKNSRISYQEVIELIQSTKCIVDILPPVQTGMSLRPLEALFFNKKLITNFKQIQDYPFYNAKNIYIIGKDSPKKISEFLKEDTVHIPDSIKKYYVFSEWMKRFSCDLK